MTNVFDQFDATDNSNVFDQFDNGGEASSPSAARRYIGDPAVSALKGAVGLDEGIVGLADLATGGRAGKLVKDSGIDFQRAQQGLDELYSPEQRLSNESVQQANDVLPTIGAIAKNPSVIPHQIIQSAPLMLGGQAIARGAMSLAPKLAPLAAGAIGEGVVTAGSNTEQVRQQSGNELISPMQSALAAGSGLVTGAITQGSGQLASKLGVGDVNTMLLGGNQQSATKGLTRRIAETGGLEAGQEFLQSGQEQAATNQALNKPLGEGVGNAAALGAVTGFGMGIPAAIAQPSGPLTRASTSAPEVPVVDPAQLEPPVEPPETAATTETPISNTDTPVEENPAAVATSNTDNATTPPGSKLYGTEEELAQAKQRAATRTEELKKDFQVKDTHTQEDYQFLRDQILHGNNSFEGAIQNLSKQNAERPNTITPASTGTDNKLPESSTGEARTEIPGAQEGSEVTQGAIDQKLTGENNGQQNARSDESLTRTNDNSVKSDVINDGVPEDSRADARGSTTHTVNADGRTNGDSSGSNGRGLPGDAPRGVGGTGGISNTALGDNGSLGKDDVHAAGNKLPDELKSPVDTAQQPKQEIQDGEKTSKETTSAGQERLLGTFKTSKGSVYQVHGDGTTSRDKAARNDPGHEGDSGEKARSVKTIYINTKAWGIPQDLDFRVVDLGNNKASLVWRNKDGQFGGTEDTLNISYSTTPKVGLHPVELWKEQDNVDNRPLSPGVRVFKKMHPGNPITEYLENKQNEDNIGINDTQETTNPVTQAESTQPVTGADTVRADAVDQKEEAKLVDESVKPYALSTGKNTFTSKAADTLLDNPKKPDVTRDSHDKVEVSKGVFQLIPKAANSKSSEIDGIKPQEQDETTTIPKQPVTTEAKQPNKQVPIPANSNEVAAQSGEATDGKEEVQGKSPSQAVQVKQSDNVDVKETQQAEATPETETPEQEVAINKKHPWEMTSDEYIASQKSEYPDDKVNGDLTKFHHKQSVESALRRGEITSSNPSVIEYPDLVSKYSKKAALVKDDDSDKSIPKKDKDLLTAEEIETRLQSIHKQIQALDDISNPRNMDSYNKKHKNLVDRREDLSTRINKIKRESKFDENAKTKPVQPEPATDTIGTPAANVNSTDGQKVLGQETVTNETPVASESKEPDNAPLSIFTQMEEAKKLPRKEVVAAEKAAQERMDASPIADKLNYIHKNYYSLVQELIDRKDDPVKLTNCKTL